jgi:polygalacturonase
VKQFIEEMLSHLIDQNEAEKKIQSKGLSSTVQTYPFTASAFELLSDYACQDVIKSTPRNIIKAINECAIAAWDSQADVIDDGNVNTIAPIIFE